MAYELWLIIELFISKFTCMWTWLSKTAYLFHKIYEGNRHSTIFFSCGRQNHIISYKTKCDVRAKDSVYKKKKNSKILLFLFWLWLPIVSLLLIVHQRQKESCRYYTRRSFAIRSYTIRRFACNCNMNSAKASSSVSLPQPERGYCIQYWPNYYGFFSKSRFFCKKGYLN